MHVLIASFGGPMAGPIAALVAFGAVLFGGVALVLRRANANRKKKPGLVKKPARAPGPLVCPSCMREYPQGNAFCPVDARKLVPAEELSDRRPPGVRCPRCRRAFEPSTRFCPVDADELVPQAIFDATHDHEHDHGDDLHGGDGSGKICPLCACKYGIDASFCGKDGSELVTVN